MSKKIIHVNQQIIQHNRKYNTSLPPITMKENGLARYAQEIEILGSSKIIHSPHEPLSCGARMWIETESDVELIGESSWKELSDIRKDDREKHK